MLKVCHIISGDLWAGAEVMDYRLVRKLKRFPDIQVFAILFNEGRLADEFRSLGVPVDVVSERQSSSFRLIREIGRILTRESPDIVHTHRYKENLLAFLSTKYPNGIRLVTTQHGMPETFGRDQRMKYRLLHKLNFFVMSRSFHKVVAVSRDIRDRFINEYGFMKRKVEMIHNGTEIPVDVPIRREKNVFKVGSLGRLFPVKDYPLMVETARELSRKTDQIHFELAGDGPERTRIRNLVARYGLGETFRVREFVQNPSDFYHDLDLYINTSFHEGIPLSVLEAMSFGIPVVAPNVGGLTEILEDGIEGYLVEERDPEAFAQKILLLFQDDVLRRSMGSSARERIERDFSDDRMAQDYRRLYLDVVGIRAGTTDEVVSGTRKTDRRHGSVSSFVVGREDD